MRTEKPSAKLTDAKQMLRMIPSPFIDLTAYQMAFRFPANSRALLWGAQPSGS